jgi:hypothetical protein
MKMPADFNEDRNICLGIARSAAPYDTGNLRYNAIKSELVYNGFNIIYDLTEAFYIYFLEEGTKFTQRHIGFIQNNTVPLIQNFLSSKYNEDDKTGLEELKLLSQQGERDIPTIKGMETELLARGERLQDSLMKNTNILENQYAWHYKADY